MDEGELMMRKKTTSKGWRSTGGFSMVELVMVLSIASILCAVAVPQLISQRRLTRSTGVTREIMTQMRLARQMAMTQAGATPTGVLRRVAYTFQYDNATKQISVIGPIPAGTAALDVANGYPNNPGSSVAVLVFPPQGGVAPSATSTAISTGVPALPTPVLAMTSVKLGAEG